MSKTITVSDETWAKIKDQIKQESTEGCIIIKDKYGKDLFYSTKNNIKYAVLEATGEKISLTNADLTDADLIGADLIGADLAGANLTGADLTGADLTDANLTGACLKNANLTRADLTGADLTGADLTGCTYYMGNGNKNFKTLCKYIKTIKHIDGSFDNLST